MEQHRNEVRDLLVHLQKSGETFIGPTVHNDVNHCKYPGIWMDTLRRYVQLAHNTSTTSLYVQFYLDLCATVLTKKIITIDIHRIVGTDDPAETVESSDMRIIHAIMFKMSVSNMLACICECVLKSPPLPDGTAAELTAKLYGHIETWLKEKFYKNSDNGKYYAREKFDVTKTVHELVDTWLLHEALPHVVSVVNAHLGYKNAVSIPKGLEMTRNLSSDFSFFGVSHCYWLWLHLTAAGIQTVKSESDFLAMFYAFDLFVFCPQCSSHFVQHRSAFYTRDPYTVSVRTTYTAPEIVYRMHNLVNRETGKEVLPVAVMSDYKGYWERYSLLEA